MNFKSTFSRLVSVFVGTAIPNIGAGAFLDVDVWKSSVMAGAVAVLSVIQKLAVAYRDGKLTVEEVDGAFR